MCGLALAFRIAYAGSCPALPHGTFEWSYATFLFLSAAQAILAPLLSKVKLHRLILDLVRRRREAGEPHRYIARIYNVSHRTISRLTA